MATTEHDQRRELYAELSPELKELVAVRQVVSYRGDEVFTTEDYLISEVPITLEVNGKEFVTLLCTPLMLEELVVGFLFTDRKSTRLNSSHVKNSYAVFCLKKKNNDIIK